MKKYVTFSPAEAKKLGVVQEPVLVAQSQMSPVYCPNCGSQAIPQGDNMYYCPKCHTILWGD